MREMTARLDADEALAAAYADAHRDYLVRRAEIADVPEITGRPPAGCRRG